MQNMIMGKSLSKVEVGVELQLLGKNTGDGLLHQEEGFTQIAEKSQLLEKMIKDHLSALEDGLLLMLEGVQQM